MPAAARPTLLPQPSRRSTPLETLPSDGRLLGRRAIALVASAIGFGGLAQLFALWLSHRSSIEPATLIRYDIVLTLGMYAVVAALIVSQITPSVRLQWGEGALLPRIGLGVLVGGGISLVLLTLVSTAAGHLSPDPRVVLMMSEGDPSHIIISAGIACVAAPLVEETLFRGLLLEALRPRGQRVAIVGSALAFAVWHFIPGALIYYTALGVTLGRLYLRRGLVSSIAAHVAFNGVLTVAAILVVVAPAKRVEVDGVSLALASDWSSVQTTAVGTAFRGPSGAAMEIQQLPTPVEPDLEATATRLQSLTAATGGQVQVDSPSVRTVTFPMGSAVEADVTEGGHAGMLVLVPRAGTSYEFVLLSAGSDRAVRDFQTMLQSARLG